MEDFEAIAERLRAQAVRKTGSGEAGSGRCPDCGAAVSDLPEWSRCDRCEAERERAELAAERYRGAAEGLDRLQEIGARLGRASLETFVRGPHNELALRRALVWLEEDPRPNLIATGPIGAGKSYLVACLFHELHARETFALWLNAVSLKGIGEPAEELRRVAGRVPVLFLDDLGKVHPGRAVSWVEECYYAVIDERYRNELPTVVTTEWQSGALAERVGVSVVSRLEHGAVVVGIGVPKVAYRKPRGAAQER